MDMYDDRLEIVSPGERENLGFRGALRGRAPHRG